MIRKVYELMFKCRPSNVINKSAYHQLAILLIQECSLARETVELKSSGEKVIAKVSQVEFVIYQKFCREFALVERKGQVLEGKVVVLEKEEFLKRRVSLKGIVFRR